MQMKDYFENTEGTGVMSTADGQGKVDAAIYARPHVTEDGIAFAVRPGEHEIFTDRDTALRHADWLRGMKERFRDKKRELLSLSKKYKDVGEWIEPS